MTDEVIARRWMPHGERANTLTHAAGAALSVVALCFMVVYAAGHGDAYRIVSVSIFGGSMVFLYLASTFYHAVHKPSVKRILRIVDHACIYVLIAGTYTPFTLVSIRGGWGWSLFGITWGLALLGVVFKLFFTGRFKVLSVAIYIGMGWLGVVAIKPVVESVPAGGIAWLVTGGLAYTFGVVFYMWRTLPHHHAIWHLFVMTGTFSHFAAVFWYVLPAQS